MTLGLAVAGAAAAQEQAAAAAAPQQVQEVVVTGSRIARRDFTSNSPIVTVNPSVLENSSNVSIEANLNRLPQFVPAQNMTGVANSGDVQPTATNSIGISTLSLRGLGPNRGLVLADGKRLMPSNGLMVIDINTIPTAMIDRVEVVTGGASAVYGPDAVSGVVNFVLRKNFQGLELDTQYGVTQKGDGQEFKISGLLGANFADDKGNATFGLEHYTREGSFQKNRDFYTRGWASPLVVGNDFFFHGAAFNPAAFNAPSAAAVNALFSGRAAGTVVPTSGVQFWIDPNGHIFTGASGIGGGQGAAGAYRYTGPVNNAEIGHITVHDTFSPGSPLATGLKSNQTNYFVTAPTNRWTIFGSAHYDFNDYVTAYVRGTYVQNKTHTVLFPTPFITGWGVNIPYDGVDGSGAVVNGVASPHPVNNELRDLLNSRPDPTADWELYQVPDPNAWMPPRSTRDTNSNWQVVAGLTGKVPTLDWTWDVYGSHGESMAYSLGEGYASLVRYQQLLRAPNYGANATITGNQGAPNFGFGSATIHCTSGFYDAIFNGGRPSQDCVEAITARIQNTTQMEQNIVEGTISGTLYTLPAGDLGFSLGASYREDFLTYTPDVLQSVVSFADQVAGVYPTAYMNSAWSAREGFGELLVPVVRDLPFAKQFNLELGARYSAYDGKDRLNNIDANIKSGWTYKILGDWAINDFARVRGGFNLAVRAPNLGELFLGRQQVFAGGAFTQYGNPCSTGTLAPFGANPASNSGGAAGAANARAICEALMTPTGAANFYGNPALQTPGFPSGFIFTIQNGNPNLQPETARTWTAGLVLRSPWDSPALSRLTASIDWYKISIYNAIQFESVDAVRAACLTLPSATAVGSPECSKVSYNPGTGAEAPTTIQFNNLSTIKTSGIDVQVNWAADLADMGLGAPGAVDLTVLVNWLDYFDSSNAPGAPFTPWKGTLGPNLAGFQAGSAFPWKSNVTLGYSYGPGHISLTWRHLPRVHPSGFYLAGGTPNAANNTKDTPSHDEFNLAGSWTIGQRYTIRAGVDNLFDVEPEITGAQLRDQGANLASPGYGTSMEGLYDALGRRFYVGVKARF